MTQRTFKYRPPIIFPLICLLLGLSALYFMVFEYPRHTDTLRMIFIAATSVITIWNVYWLGRIVKSLITKQKLEFLDEGVNMPQFGFLYNQAPKFIRYSDIASYNYRRQFIPLDMRILPLIFIVIAVLLYIGIILWAYIVITYLLYAIFEQGAGEIELNLYAQDNQKIVLRKAYLPSSGVYLDVKKALFAQMQSARDAQ